MSARVECFRDADCAPGGCVSEVCRSPCVSDKDCARFGLVCEGGQCWLQIREPNTYYCEGGSPHQCYGKGSSATILDSCSEFEICQVHEDGTSASRVFSGIGADGEGG